MENKGLLAKQYRDEEAARAHLESIRWPDGPECPKCGLVNEAYKITPKPGSTTRKGLWKCKGCRKQFTVTVNSIFEDSHIPLHKWLLAIHLMCSSKKGISAHQLMRNLDLKSYRSAWFMAHRIRWALTQEPMKTMLGGPGQIVEADETYIGPRREKGVRPGMPGADSKKVPVVALLERSGNVRSFPVERVTAAKLKPILKEFVDPRTNLITDENKVYVKMGREFGSHRTVNHRAEEYVRMDGKTKVTTNTVEAYFALLKRGSYGVYHHWSKKYLTQYLREFDWRYNVRKLSDAERAIVAMRMTSGKRLMLNVPSAAQKN